MGIALAHDQVVADRVEFTALISGHHPGGDPGGAHQEGKTGGVMLAKPLAGREQETIREILTDQRRGQGINERLVAEHRQGLLHDGGRIVKPLPPVLRQRARAGIAAGG